MVPIRLRPTLFRRRHNYGGCEQRSAGNLLRYYRRAVRLYPRGCSGVRVFPATLVLVRALRSRGLVSQHTAEQGILHSRPQSHFVSLQYNKDPCCAV